MNLFLCLHLNEKLLEALISSQLSMDIESMFACVFWIMLSMIAARLACPSVKKTTVSYPSLWLCWLILPAVKTKISFWGYDWEMNNSLVEWNWSTFSRLRLLGLLMVLHEINKLHRNTVTPYFPQVNKK